MVDKIKFSVLMSVYARENPKYLDSALKSIWDNQTYKPTEIVLVKDGPLTDELEKVIQNFSNTAPLKIVKIYKNMGLGIALSRGVVECSYNIIARMDSDDISSPSRFEKQLPYIVNGYHVVSSWSCFFENTIDNIIALKKRPQNHEDILNLAKKRSPVCHACTMFDKSKVLEAGNYRHVPYYEDYDLWVRMFLNNSKFYNVQEYIYYVRSSKSQFGRRGGFRYLKTEIQSHLLFRKLGFINSLELVNNILIRILLRLLPVKFRRFIYLKVWKHSS